MHSKPPLGPREKVLNFRDLAQANYDKHLQSAKLTSKVTYINYPNHKALSTMGATTDVTTCCVIILYDNSQNYIFGHYNSLTYNREYKERNLVKDDLPEILKDNAFTMAIIIGGDKHLFESIKDFLTEKKITITASYFDNNSKNHIEESLSMKSVIFDPKSKTATVYSALIPQTEIELKGKQSHIDVEEAFKDHITALRELTQQLYKKLEMDSIEYDALGDEDNPDSPSTPYTSMRFDFTSKDAVSISSERKADLNPDNPTSKEIKKPR